MPKQIKPLLLLFVLFTNYLYSQENATSIIVRVNYTCLNFEAINDYNLRNFNFEDVLNEKGIRLLDPLFATYSNINKMTFRKMFPNLTTNDTVSSPKIVGGLLVLTEHQLQV